MQLFTPYRGTGGYVERPASIERAVREARDGTLSKRQQDLLLALAEAGKAGATWQQLGLRLNMHHGQVSGALSNLHKAGEVFMLRNKYNKSHPYVAKQFRHAYTDEQVFDERVQTQAGKRRALLEQLLAQCTEAGRTGWGSYQLTEIGRIVDKVNAHDNRTTTTKG